MKVGDLVKLIGSYDPFATGVLIRIGPTGWWDILITDEGLVTWPESQLEVISACKMSIAVV